MFLGNLYVHGKAVNIDGQTYKIFLQNERISIETELALDENLNKIYLVSKAEVGNGKEPKTVHFFHLH